MKKLVFLLMIIAIPCLVFAETIVFKSGKIIEGDIVERAEKYTKVDLDGLKVTFYADDADRIDSIDGVFVKAVAKPEVEENQDYPEELWKPKRRRDSFKKDYDSNLPEEPFLTDDNDVVEQESKITEIQKVTAVLSSTINETLGYLGAGKSQVNQEDKVLIGSKKPSSKNVQTNNVQISNVQKSLLRSSKAPVGFKKFSAFINQHADQHIEREMRKIESNPRAAIRNVIIKNVFSVFFSICLFVSIWIINKKAGYPGWACLIPIYGLYISVKIAGKSGWWVLVFFIPIFNIIAWIVISMGTAKNFGKGVWFGIGLVFLSFIFYPILAFTDSEYHLVGE